jgi:serpin B
MKNPAITTFVGCLLIANPALAESLQVEPAPVDPLVRSTVNSSSAFAIDLYHQLAKENEGKNLFFSPYSISTALTMTLEGARGKTMQEMGQVLRFPKSNINQGEEEKGNPWQTSEMHSGYGKLEARFNRKEKPYELAVANALWAEKTMPLRPEFVKTISNAYSTDGIFSMDFVGNPSGSCDHINRWVEDKTNHRIKDLIPKSEISSSTRLVLSNAIYFKADWASKFDKTDTSERDFTRADGTKVKTPMMSAKMPIRYGDEILEEGRYIIFAELPYKNDELSMLVIIGGSDTPLNVIEKHLSIANLTQWIGKLNDTGDGFPVKLPKFKMESKYKLNNTLMGLGMPTAFSAEKADFAGISGSQGKGLHISSVLHKGFIDVSEEGAEAAAAAVVITNGKTGSGGSGPGFDASRPFIYLIRDRQTGAILFMGRMMDPTAK